MTKEHDDHADRARLEAHRGGDARAGKELYRRYFGKVRRYFANKACQQADVEDLVSRTFEIFFAPKTRLVEADHFGVYVLGIARNVWFGHLRERMRFRSVDVPSEDPELFERYIAEQAISLRTLGAGKTTIIEREERLRKLLDALRELPIMYQEVLELHYWEELTFEQLAPILKVPPGTAKSRIRLVKVKLYETLQGVSVHGDERQIDQVVAQVDEWAQRVAQKIRRSIPN